MTVVVAAAAYRGGLSVAAVVRTGISKATTAAMFAVEKGGSSSR
jgi:hypothetical protein